MHKFKIRSDRNSVKWDKLKKKIKNTINKYGNAEKLCENKEIIQNAIFIISNNSIYAPTLKQMENHFKLKDGSFKKYLNDDKFKIGKNVRIKLIKFAQNLETVAPSNIISKRMRECIFGNNYKQNQNERKIKLRFPVPGNEAMLIKTKKNNVTTSRRDKTSENLAIRRNSNKDVEEIEINEFENNHDKEIDIFESQRNDENNDDKNKDNKNNDDQEIEIIESLSNKDKNIEDENIEDENNEEKAMNYPFFHIPFQIPFQINCFTKK